MILKSDYYHPWFEIKSHKVTVQSKRNTMYTKPVLFALLFIQIIFGKEYFQQYVNYHIDARLVESKNKINATEKLVYVNNSPDTLDKVYFHLYLNKYKKGAFTPEGTPRPQTDAYIKLHTIKINGIKTKDYDIHVTLMQINLPLKLNPGDSVHFYFDFSSKLPYASDRYGYYGSHYDVGNWFPVPVVYDREGWHLNQHIDNEFYQEWGDFRVNITVPKGFIVGATGRLINADSAMMDTTRDVRDWYLHNIEDTTSTTTWQYEANKVHDFAWTTDPEYRYITRNWNGIDIHYLVMRYNYEAWKKEFKAGLEAVKFFSKMIGHYPYDQITVADTYITSGGMEYPNIVFINTYIDPEYRLTFFRAVIIHEIAHNWFYGLLASNQTEFEWQDEGFTQFAEIMAMEKIYGRKNNYYYSGYDWYSRTFSFEMDDRLSCQYSALRLIKSGREEDPVNTMPDKFRYGVTASEYDKMASILIMLKNTMGNDLFWQGIREYFKEWAYRHPQPVDFKHVMEKTVGADLDWFFNEWIYSLRQLDYSLKHFKNIKTDQGHQVAFEIENLKSAHMPVDILFKLDNGDSILYHIPVDYFYPRSATRKYLPAWHFSQKIYSDTLNVPDAVDEIVIDPKNVLLDVNRLNNSSRCIPKMNFTFLKNQRFAPPLDAYLWETWPGIFYNDIDKFKVGLAVYGSYLNHDHRITLKTWYKTKTNDVDFSLNYAHPLYWLKRSHFYSGISRLDGLEKANISIAEQQSDNLNYILNLKHYRLFDSRYLNYPWQKGTFNTAGFIINYADSKPQSESVLSINLKNSLAGSSVNFSLARLDLRQTFYSHYSDYALQLGFSGGTAAKQTPVQEMFNLAGANGVSEVSDPYYRARGTLPVMWRRDGHLYKDSFAKVRGISLITDNYLGNNMLALSTDFKFPNIFSYIGIGILDFFDNALFADAGDVWQGSFPGLNSFAKSAGLSVSYSNFHNLQYLFGLREIKLDFPVWVDQKGNHKNGLEFRWLISFSFKLTRNLVF